MGHKQRKNLWKMAKMGSCCCYVSASRWGHLNIQKVPMQYFNQVYSEDIQRIASHRYLSVERDKTPQLPQLALKSERSFGQDECYPISLWSTTYLGKCGPMHYHGWCAPVSYPVYILKYMVTLYVNNYRIITQIFWTIMITPTPPTAD